MKKILALVLAVIIIIAIAACDNNPDNTSHTDTDTDTNSDTNTNTDTNTNPDTDTVTDTNTGTGGDDNPDEPDPKADRIDYNVKVEQAINVGVFENTDTFGNEGTEKQYTDIIDIDVAARATGGNTYHITSGGTYRLFGTSVNGQIRVRADGQDVILILDNLNLTYNGDEAPIYAEKCKSVTIIIAKNSENTITDSTNNTNKGAIYVKSSNLVIDGEGIVNINANFKSGIFNTKELTINGGIFNITANYHGVYGEQKLTVNGGKYDITSAKNGFKSGDYDETKPLETVIGAVVINSASVAINASSNGISSYGTVEINNGRITLDTRTDGIDATENVIINGGTIIINAAGDGIKSDKNVTISGSANVKAETEGDGIDADNVIISTTGVIYIKTNATYIEDPLGSYVLVDDVYYKIDAAEYIGKTLYMVVSSCKGIKAVNKITVSNGTIGIDSSEDAFKSTEIEVTGGRIVSSSNEDAFDSGTSIIIGSSPDISIEVLNANKGLKAPSITVNGGTMTVVTISDALDSDMITINGGTLYLLETVDYGAGSFIINGGLVVSIATTNTPKTPTNSDQKYIAASVNDKELYVYGKCIRISGSGVDTVLKIPKSYANKLSVVLSSSLIVTGEYMIEAGTYTGGVPSALVCTGGTFTSETSQSVTVQ